MKNSRSRCRGLLGVLALFVATPLAAHHSSAMYDQTKSITLKGEVKEFQWTNPHCWIQLVLFGANEEEWSVQMGPPSNLYRDGWRPGTLKPGDSILVVVHPMIDDRLALAHPWQVTLTYKRMKGVDRLVPTDCKNDRNPLIDGKFTIAPPRSQ